MDCVIHAFPPFYSVTLCFRGGSTHPSDCQIGSHSSRNDEEIIKYDADVDHIDFGEEEKSKSEEDLTDQVSDLAAVRSKRNVVKDSESADGFILDRKTVVHFVQDSIVEAVDRQKKHADNNGRANGLLFNEGDLILLSMVLPFTTRSD